MKHLYPRFFLIALLFVMIPYLTVCVGQDRTPTAPQTSPVSETETKELENYSVPLYRTKTKTIEQVPLYEYLCAVVAGEMQANYEPEALKAQTVAAFTYMVYRYEYYTEHPDAQSEHPGAYVCDDYHHCKAFLPASEAREKWGKSWYNKYYHNITDAVSAVLGKVITYNGTPINAVFHAISCGKTESAQTVWGSEIPYLVSADSSVDTAAKGYQSTVTLSHSECKEIIEKELKCTASSDPTQWFGTPQYTAAGTVDTISVCGQEISGTKIRTAFSLRSAAFEISINKQSITFTVRGYGHQVGMSQNGANEMAKEGKTYEQILAHYYAGTKIEEYSFS